MIKLPVLGPIQVEMIMFEILLDDEWMQYLSAFNIYLRLFYCISFP